MDTKIVIHVSKQKTRITVYSEHATVITVVGLDGNVVTTTEKPSYASVM